MTVSVNFQISMNSSPTVRFEMTFNTTKKRLLVEASSKSSPYSHTCKVTVGDTQAGKHA